MINMTKWVCAILIMGPTLAWAETSDADLLEKYRKIYDDTAAEYETVFRMASQAWPIDYIKALQALQSKSQQSGDLDGWEAVNQELNRFQRDMIIASNEPSHAELCALQDSYRAHAEQLASEKNSKLEDLRSKYVSRLATLQREWTQQGKFNYAFKARDEIERVGGPPKEPTVDEEPPERAESAATPSPVPTETMTHADGTIVYPPGAMASNEKGLVFRTKLLASTEHSPWSADVALKLWETSDKASDTFERDHLVGTVDGKEKTDTRFVRAALRMARADVEKRDLELQVQYYAKPAGGSGDPRMVMQRHAKIPALDTRLVYVDVAPVSIDSLSRAVTIGPFREHSQTVGDKFYGYIVSVLDADGMLLYQGASSSTLAKQATVPEPREEPGQGWFPVRRDEGERDADIQALRAEVEAARMALREASSWQRFRHKTHTGREAIREAEERLKEANEALRRAEGFRR